MWRAVAARNLTSTVADVICGVEAAARRTGDCGVCHRGAISGAMTWAVVEEYVATM
jgi:hypothetical protein